MALTDFFKSFTTKGKEAMQQAKLLNDAPIFSQFGDNIYASDVVQNCIDVIATEISKLSPMHTVTNAKGMQTTPQSSLNRLFRVSPNPLMTTRDFLEKTVWLLFLNYNAFIYPMYEVYKAGDVYRKRYTGFYPLNPSQVVFEQDPAGRLYVRLYFRQGENFQIPYDSIIHLRKKFSANDIMGGGMNGQPDNAPLLNILETNNTVIQGIGKAVKTSLAIRGILKISTMLDDEKQKAERARFERAMLSGDTGILPLDLKAEYTPVGSDPKLVDKDTLEFLENKVLRWYGVSLPIISGDFTDEQYQAFYEKTLEPLLISLGQAFSKVLFSERELDVGNAIVFYQKNMMYLSSKSKIEMLKTAGEQGLLTDDQKLALLGYPPIGGEEGARRTQSLNFVDTKLVNDYQMQKAKTPIADTGGEGDAEN
jgi:HK97 family phage portal protein